MDINDVHRVILFVLDKDHNGYVSHEEVDDILDRSQMVLFNQYFNNPKIPASAQPQIYSENQRIHDSLAPFKEKYTFLTTDTPAGVLTLPAGFMHLLGMYTSVYNSTLARNVYSGVQVLNEEELIERLESQVIPVSADDPICIMNKQNKIQLFPETTQSGAVFYLRKPVKPVFGYTTSGRTLTYSSGASTQLEWKESDIQNIIVIALSYLGINLSSAEVVQYAEGKIAQGQ